jgi:hypothetical protein
MAMHAFSRLASTAAVLFAATAMAPQPAPAGHIDCGFHNKTTVVTVPGNHTSTTRAYTQLATTHIEVTGSNCVLVQFSAQFRTRTPKNIRLRVTLDGQPTGVPNFANVTTSGNGYDERALTFVITGANSTSDIAIQFSSFDRKPVTVRNGLMRVDYAGPF